MIESRRNLMTLAIAVALLAAIYAALLLAPERAEYRASDDQISLLSINPKDVSAASTRWEGVEHAYIQSDGQWYRDGEPADYNATDLRITYISYLYSDNLVATGAENLGIYGLDEPLAEASFETFDGQRYSVRFGIETVDQSSRYMMIEGQSDVYTVPAEAFEVIFDNEVNGEVKSNEDS